MSNRWKYQIKMGLYWGFMMIVLEILFKIKEIPFMEQVLNPSLYLRMILFVFTGVFILGYGFWKMKSKNIDKQ